MAFNAATWLSETVRTSSYTVAADAPVFGELDISAKALATALASITDLPIDKQATAALLPARVPVNVPVPSALRTEFPAVVAQLAQHAATLHPAVFHALLAVALEGDDPQQKALRLESLQPLFDGSVETKLFQPTLSWLSLLQPDWFNATVRVVPAVRGGTLPLKETQGVLTSVALSLGKIRINPVDVFTSAKPVSFSDAKVLALPTVWENQAQAAWSLPYPPVTSLWLMAMGRKSDFWDFVPVGAALYSPFYSDGEVDAIAYNRAQACLPGSFFRPGNGIADIYPLADDAVLSDQFNIAGLFDAPASVATFCAMGNLFAHPGCAASLPPAWATLMQQKLAVASSLHLVPSFSAFSSTDMNGQPQDAPAVAALDHLAKQPTIAQFGKLLRAVLTHQSTIGTQFNNVLVDAGDMGYPREAAIFPVGSSVRQQVAPAVVAPHLI